MVYRKGFMAELRGMTSVAMATLTSPGTAIPVEASRPSRPTGNQHTKSVAAMVTRRRAMLRSCCFLLVSVEDIVLVLMAEYMAVCPTAMATNRIMLRTIITPKAKLCPAKELRVMGRGMQMSVWL